MTRGKKYLTLFLFELGLLGAAAGAGAHYWHEYRYRKPLADCQAGRIAAEKQGNLMATRNFLMETEVGILIGNYAYAFERMVPARFAAQAAGLKIDKDLDDIQNLLITQNPTAKDRVYDLANRVLPIAHGNPTPDKTDGKGAAAKDGEQGAAGGQPGGQGGAAGGHGGGAAAGQGTGTTGGAPGASGQPGGQGAGQAGSAQGTGSASGSAATKAPAALLALPGATGSSAGPGGGATGDPGLGVGRKALLDAKVSLVSGIDGPATIKQIAQARVLLDEAGHPDVDALLDGAIDALRHHDEAKARSAVDSALAQLRSP